MKRFMGLLAVVVAVAVPASVAGAGPVKPGASNDEYRPACELVYGIAHALGQCAG